MRSLWEIDAPDVDLGYRNLRDAAARCEHEMRNTIDEMWRLYHPYADRRFCSGFAHDLDAHFWEMYIGVELLKAGKMLLPTSERSRKGGQPDLCVLDGERRIWIEATCPGTGADGPDQVRGPKPINEGGSFEPAPARQVDLRLTSALSTKQKAIERYLQEGVIAATDVRVVAICASRFSLYVSEWPIPGIMKAVFPIGDEYFRIDKQTGDVVGQGFHGSFEIPRQGPAIERNAFLTPQYAAISAIIWSRISVGNMSRAERPLTLVHNPIATVQFPTHWGVWDREFVTTPHPDAFTTTDILAKADRND